jgi:hypothetical protein
MGNEKHMGGGRNIVVKQWSKYGLDLPGKLLANTMVVILSTNMAFVNNLLISYEYSRYIY